jgi:hypothetical protein
LGQLVKCALEATAARRRDGEKTSIETLADGFGQPACAVAHTIDRADDGVAACDHFLDTVQAILDAAVVVEKCRDPRRRRRAQVGNDGGAPAKVENAVRRWCAPRPMVRNAVRVNVVGSQTAPRPPGCGELAQSGLSLACTGPCHDECALALSQLALQPPKGAIRLECKVPRGSLALALMS